MFCSRYFFHIGFSGMNYRGWQIQAGALNVQGVLEAALSQVLKEKITIMGCGRTDALVHASQFFFHADIEKEWDFDLIFRINKILPSDIAVFDVLKVTPNAHARFDAIERTYDYFIHTYKDPFLSNVSSLYLLGQLDHERMHAAVALLPKYQDYKSFCTTPMRNRTTVCHVTSAVLLHDPVSERYRFTISANRFLGSMIRIIVRKLLDIGAGELSVEEFEDFLSRQTPQRTIEPAYPQGLFLSSVKYPYFDLSPRTEFSVINGHRDWIDTSQTRPGSLYLQHGKKEF